MPLSDPVGPTIDELQVVGLFGALDDEALAALAEKLGVVRVSPGEVVFREGDPGRAMYVVLSGELELEKGSTRGKTVRVAFLRSGDWFGEMSLVDVMARPATARALSASRLIEIRPTHLDAMYRGHLKAYALLMMNLARQLSRKLRIAEGIVADAVTQVIDPHADDPDKG